jgi:aspartyl-tRNA(Asn)/glutamyl-tRNA(Gln) amidotransferase subunit B
MADYYPTIGLEVHAELKTRTKMFCDCTNDPDEKKANTNVCPVCMGHPGALPTINKQAVEAVLKVGLAIGAEVNPVSKFDRKNYFYPDLPKGYQISQFDKPLVVGGTLRGVKVHHIHLEEDAGKLVHVPDGKSTLVDYNRSSVPLMELVTEPDIHSPEDGVAFMKELQLILRYIGASDADLERGQMRADANVSLSADAGKLGTRAEVKNLNSFNAVFSAIKYEIKRQAEILDKGETVRQETRGWDDVKQKTVSQRSKEHAHDYRYFPEPDLPPMNIAEAFNVEDLKRHLPELPRARQARFVKEYGLSDTQAAALVETKELGEYFEAAYSELATRDEKTTSRIDKRPEELLYNYLTSDLGGLLNETGTTLANCKVSPAELAALVDMICDGKIMSRQAKDILRKMYETGESAEVILEQEGLHTVSDEAELVKVVESVIAEHAQAVADYKAGKQASMQFLIGQAMKKLRGRGNPESLRELFERLLSS